MAIKFGVSREERQLLPECVEDYVGENNAVRVVEAFVEGLELGKLGIAVKEAGVGASSYDPKALLKLYIYGYLNRVRSSRDLEKAARRNLEVIWLMRKLTPDHWTINEFRKKQGGKFKKVFREFHLVCGQLGLFGAELVAIDSAYFKASNNPSKNQTRGKLAETLRRIDEATEAYLARLEASEKESEAQGGAEIKDLRTRLEGLGQKREKATRLLKEIEESPTGQISQSDPDSRSLKKGQQAVVGYQVQIAVEAEHHLIVANETQRTGGDHQALAAMGGEARATLGAEKLEVVADGGYYNVDEIKACEEAGIIAYVPEKEVRKAGEGLYERQDFRHDPASDTLTCPQGQTLWRHEDTTRRGETYKVYYNTAACRSCALLTKCTKGKYRKVSLAWNLPTVEALRKRCQQAPQIFKKRSATVEHVFGTMKFWMGAGAVLTRGWKSVSAEIDLTCLAYNFKRVINIFGAANLTAWLQAR
jgi:transposase